MRQAHRKGLEQLMILNYDPENPPTCNIVIEKQEGEEEEKVCGLPVTQIVNMVDPDDMTRILAVVLLCDVHDKALENGKSLIAVSEDGEHLGVQYKQKEE